MKIYNPHPDIYGNQLFRCAAVHPAHHLNIMYKQSF